MLSRYWCHRSQSASRKVTDPPIVGQIARRKYEARPTKKPREKKKKSVCFRYISLNIQLFFFFPVPLPACYPRSHTVPPDPRSSSRPVPSRCVRHNGSPPRGRSPTAAIKQKEAFLVFANGQQPCRGGGGREAGKSEPGRGATRGGRFWYAART